MDVMLSVGLDGPGHYLGHEQTLSRMQTDYLYPSVGDRENINNWIEQGSTDVVQRARKIVQDTLESHFPKFWDEKIDENIRKNNQKNNSSDIWRQPNLSITPFLIVDTDFLKKECQKSM